MTAIITADDFGLDRGTSEAIVESMARNWVTHASLLVNLGYAAEACELARSRGVATRIGVHLNFSEGEPITAAIKDSATFCANGRFLPVEEFPRYRPLSEEHRKLVGAEVRAQLAAAASHGIAISHIDSHNDVHISPSIARIVADVAREFQIPRIRISRNCGLRQGILRLAHHRAYNAWLARRQLRGVLYYGSIDDMVWLGRRGQLDPTTPIEIMTHPRMEPGGEIVDLPSPEPLETRLKRLRPYLA
jgi:predicted glycoside hydrolase/deacetylase ChbG (UPF0249 family)